MEQVNINTVRNFDTIEDEKSALIFEMDKLNSKTDAERIKVLLAKIDELQKEQEKFTF